MKKIFFLAVFCLLASASPVNAQLIIRNSGHAEIGHDPFDPVPEGLNPSYYQWLDTTTVLKVFGNYGEYAAGAHMSFGDNLLWDQYNVAVGELGYTDTDLLWLQGKRGTYLTAGVGAIDTIMYYDYTRSNAVQFNKAVQTSGLFVQSDERFKEGIEPVTGVLPSLSNLEAVTYRLKNNDSQSREKISLLPAVTEKDAKDKAFFEQYYANNEKGSNRYGFLAQNVKEVFLSWCIPTTMATWQWTTSA
ncbi:MAG: tail fiber domain-containing protein [Muribaculaceae bacterium]|nr:tail fiber domain-containing protein [Muribaculaceae bacterium]